MRDFKRLDVWTRAVDLGEEVYKITKDFPGHEIYALTSQLRRASVSVSSNIAEGCGRRTSRDFVQFLYNAMGSLREVESQLIIASRLSYLSEDRLKELSADIDKLSRMLNGFIDYISEQGSK